MVKRVLVLTVALLLQYASVIQAAEPESTPRGNTTTTLAKLRADLEVARNHTGIPGMSVAIIHKGKLIFAEGFGKRNKKEPFTPETRSMLGSLTKAFTATAIGELVAEGKLDWDTTPVNTYLPEFETIDPVLTSQLTLQDLLSHRTNFPALDMSWVWGTEDVRDLIKRIRYVNVKPKLGVNTNYNNIMFCVAGEAAANVAGVPFVKLVRNKVLEPLSLSNTGFTMGELAKKPNYAVPFTAASYEDSVAGRFTELPMDGAAEKSAAAGDMYASVLDLARWGQAVMTEGMVDGKQVLSKEGVAATLTAHTVYQAYQRHPDFAPSMQYGMGWTLNNYKGNNVYEHGGSNFGYMTNLAIFPNAELVVAHITNADITGLPMHIAYHVADQLLGLPKSMDWITVNAIQVSKNLWAAKERNAKGNFPPRVPNKPATHGLSAYTGEYFHPGHGTTTVRLEGGQLHISLGAFKGVLSHYHYDSFTTVFEHTAVKLGELVTFSIGTDGNVSSISFSAMGAPVTAAKK
ncbi:hypothetical protein BGZ59_005173 [Podila verticillata]|nr:hypothetical protein BGZ59_005173 [Podila verticillata]KFH72073.1 hypothetical protein MVEG_02366 [Podila verticillata NRRL 6337]